MVEHALVDAGGPSVLPEPGSGHGSPSWDRGGFYGYDFLENLVVCDIHNAGRVVPQWQDIKAGDQVMLHPDVPLEVAAVDRGRWLVLHGGIAIGNAPPTFDSTWAVVLRARPGGATRLIVRMRYACKRPWARFLIEPVEVIDFVMIQKMLRGIKNRAEQTACADLFETTEVPDARLGVCGT